MTNCNLTTATIPVVSTVSVCRAEIIRHLAHDRWSMSMLIRTVVSKFKDVFTVRCTFRLSSI